MIPGGLTFVDFGFPAISIRLAPLAERLGFRRYWLGEHHSPLQCSNPLLLSGLVAGVTERLRVGAGGVCLPLHPPHAVVEDARTLTLLYGDRIDLGVCNGIGGDTAFWSLMRDGRPDRPQDFAIRAAEVAACLERDSRRRGPASGEQRASAARAVHPQLWVLGASERTARLAAELGAPFAFSEHHNTRGLDPSEMFDVYRASFTARRPDDVPRTMVVVSGLCAPTAGELGRLVERNGTAVPLSQAGRRIVETTELFCERVCALATRCRAEEVGLIDLTFNAGTDEEAFGTRAAFLEQVATGLKLGQEAGGC